MSHIHLTIDNVPLSVEPGTTIHQAAGLAGIHIPTLCASADIDHAPGACRVCLVEVEGQRNLTASCVFPVAPGMVVRTTSERVRKARKMVVELLLANHPPECNHCIRNGSCELQQVAEIGRASCRERV